VCRGCGICIRPVMTSRIRQLVLEGLVRRDRGAAAAAKLTVLLLAAGGCSSGRHFRWNRRRRRANHGVGREVFGMVENLRLPSAS